MQQITLLTLKAMPYGQSSMHLRVPSSNEEVWG